MLVTSIFFFSSQCFSHKTASSVLLKLKIVLLPAFSSFPTMFLWNHQIVWLPAFSSFPAMFSSKGFFCCVMKTPDCFVKAEQRYGRWKNLEFAKIWFFFSQYWYIYIYFFCSLAAQYLNLLFSHLSDPLIFAWWLIDAVCCLKLRTLHSFQRSIQRCAMSSSTKLKISRQEMEIGIHWLKN